MCFLVEENFFLKIKYKLTHLFFKIQKKIQYKMTMSDLMIKSLAQKCKCRIISIL